MCVFFLRVFKKKGGVRGFSVDWMRVEREREREREAGFEGCAIIKNLKKG